MIILKLIGLITLALMWINTEVVTLQVTMAVLL